MVNRDSKYKFPVFQSTQDAVSEGMHVDPYDPKLPRKHWVDLNPQVNADGECEYKVFQYKGNLVQVDPNTGQPKFKTLRISPEWAKRFNIYNPEFANSQVPDMVAGETPLPIRELKEDEEWKFGFLSEPTIIKKFANKEITVGEVPSSEFNKLLQSISNRIDSIEEQLNRLLLVLGSK